MRFSLKKPLNVVYLTGFVLSAHMALTTYVNSTFISSGCNCGIPENMIGLLYTGGSILAIIGLTSLPTLTNYLGNKMSLTLQLILGILSLSAMMFSQNPILVAIAFTLFLAVGVTVFFSIDLFVEHYSDDATTGGTRGIFLTILNIAWVVSPFLVGQLAERDDGFVIIYGIGIILSLLAIITMWLGLKSFVDSHYVQSSFFTTLKRFWQNRDLRKIFATSFMLNFFYSWMIIYIPIYLNQHLNMPWTDIGIVLAIMLLPFVLFQLPLGKLADTKYGEKEILSIGFVVMAAATLVIPFVSGTSILIWSAILFGTRIGASAVGIMTESYFFKQVADSDVDLIGFFRDASPLAFIAGPLIATGILSLFDIPLEYLFLILGVLVLLGLPFSLTIRDTR